MIRWLGDLSVLTLASGQDSAHDGEKGLVPLDS